MSGSFWQDGAYDLASQINRSTQDLLHCIEKKSAKVSQQGKTIMADQQDGTVDLLNTLA